MVMHSERYHDSNKMHRSRYDTVNSHSISQIIDTSTAWEGGQRNASGEIRAFTPASLMKCSFLTHSNTFGKRLPWLQGRVLAFFTAAVLPSSGSRMKIEEKNQHCTPWAICFSLPEQSEVDFKACWKYDVGLHGLELSKRNNNKERKKKIEYRKKSIISLEDAEGEVTWV